VTNANFFANFFGEKNLKIITMRPGRWFDDKESFRLVPPSADPDFAPEFLLRNAEKFRPLLAADKSL
jgi:hypothetical protein